MTDQIENIQNQVEQISQTSKLLNDEMLRQKENIIVSYLGWYNFGHTRLNGNIMMIWRWNCRKECLCLQPCRLPDTHYFLNGNLLSATSWELLDLSPLNEKYFVKISSNSVHLFSLDEIKWKLRFLSSANKLRVFAVSQSNCCFGFTTWRKK